jgi:hypothetical protein
MPHTDLKYSADLNIDPTAILRGIEQVIQSVDPSSGICKGRAYPAQIFHHTHILINVSLLPKPHRDAEFTQNLLGKLERQIKSHITQNCQFSLAVLYSDDGYITGAYTPQT